MQVEVRSCVTLTAKSPIKLMGDEKIKGVGTKIEFQS